MSAPTTDWSTYEPIPHLPTPEAGSVEAYRGMLGGAMTEKPAGDLALRGLAAYCAGQRLAARDLAHRARMAAPDAFAARYADGLAYAIIGDKGVRTAATAVRRFLIATDDPRQALTLDALVVKQ
ncbi:hypothetical protein [Nocardioides sp. Leaf285]|uniref:hypothetical protein n=1 Tax=Nocardioides sp. Leaf285 TaxID=1736322 RepID=UPI000702FF31|nr:hypothetical protein [Nocardioides sp. Leaf285]KQP62926.1 hypothetical protein ASF47_18105 [Nocardioides sp. Leaf285]